MKRLFKLTTVIFAGMACATFTVAAHEDDEENDEQQTQEQAYSPEATFQRYETTREAYDGRGDRRYDGRGDRRRDGLGQLQRQVDHLNGMLDHVQRSMRRYEASRDVWRHYQHVQGEVRQINRQFRRGEQYYNRRQLRAQIKHMHDEMHEIEQKLRMPSRNYYRWGG